MTLAVTLKPKTQKKILVELDAEKFERLAAHLGLFNSDFLKSLEKAETDFRAGRIRKISSLRQVRK